MARFREEKCSAFPASSVFKPPVQHFFIIHTIFRNNGWGWKPGSMINLILFYLIYNSVLLLGHLTLEAKKWQQIWTCMHKEIKDTVLYRLGMNSVQSTLYSHFCELNIIFLKPRLKKQWRSLLSISLFSTCIFVFWEPGNIRVPTGLAIDQISYVFSL